MDPIKEKKEEVIAKRTLPLYRTSNVTKLDSTTLSLKHNNEEVVGETNQNPSVNLGITLDKIISWEENVESMLCSNLKFQQLVKKAKDNIIEINSLRKKFVYANLTWIFKTSNIQKWKNLVEWESKDISKQCVALYKRITNRENIDNIYKETEELKNKLTRIWNCGNIKDAILGFIRLHNVGEVFESGFQIKFMLNTIKDLPNELASRFESHISYFWPFIVAQDTLDKVKTDLKMQLKVYDDKCNAVFKEIKTDWKVSKQKFTEISIEIKFISNLLLEIKNNPNIAEAMITFIRMRPWGIIMVIQEDIKDNLRQFEELEKDIQSKLNKNPITDNNLFKSKQEHNEAKERFLDLNRRYKFQKQKFNNFVETNFSFLSEHDAQKKILELKIAKEEIIKWILDYDNIFQNKKEQLEIQPLTIDKTENQIEKSKALIKKNFTKIEKLVNFICSEISEKFDYFDTSKLGNEVVDLTKKDIEAMCEEGNNCLEKTNNQAELENLNYKTSKLRTQLETAAQSHSIEVMILEFTKLSIRGECKELENKILKNLKTMVVICNELYQNTINDVGYFWNIKDAKWALELARRKGEEERDQYTMVLNNICENKVRLDDIQRRNELKIIERETRNLCSELVFIERKDSWLDKITSFIKIDVRGKAYLIRFNTEKNIFDINESVRYIKSLCDNTKTEFKYFVNNDIAFKILENRIKLELEVYEKEINVVTRNIKLEEANEKIKSLEWVCEQSGNLKIKLKEIEKNSFKNGNVKMLLNLDARSGVIELHDSAKNSMRWIQKLLNETKKLDKKQHRIIEAIKPFIQEEMEKYKQVVNAVHSKLSLKQANELRVKVNHALNDLNILKNNLFDIVGSTDVEHSISMFVSVKNKWSKLWEECYFCGESIFEPRREFLFQDANINSLHHQSNFFEENNLESTIHSVLEINNDEEAIDQEIHIYQEEKNLLQEGNVSNIELNEVQELMSSEVCFEAIDGNSNSLC